jgi:hypothetical protein
MLGLSEELNTMDNIHVDGNDINNNHAAWPADSFTIGDVNNSQSIPIQSTPTSTQTRDTPPDLITDNICANYMQPNHTFQPTDLNIVTNFDNLPATHHFNKTNIQTTFPPHNCTAADNMEYYGFPHIETSNRPFQYYSTQLSSNTNINMDGHTNVSDYRNGNIDSIVDNHQPTLQYQSANQSFPVSSNLPATTNIMNNMSDSSFGVWVFYPINPIPSQWFVQSPTTTSLALPFNGNVNTTGVNVQWRDCKFVDNNYN